MHVCKTTNNLELEPFRFKFLLLRNPMASVEWKSLPDHRKGGSEHEYSSFARGRSGRARKKTSTLSGTFNQIATLPDGRHSAWSQKKSLRNASCQELSGLKSSPLVVIVLLIVVSQTANICLLSYMYMATKEIEVMRRWKDPLSSWSFLGRTNSFGTTVLLYQRSSERYMYVLSV